MGTYPVLVGAEEFFFSGNEIGVFIIHGFAGTTQSMRYLGNRLAEQGMTVYGPRLTGHGTHPEEMEQATYQDWIRDAENALTRLKELCSTIFVIGLSMGGTLALYLAETHPELAGIIPINAAVNIPELTESYNTLKTEGKRFLEGIGSDIKKEGVKEISYMKTPVKSIGEMITLMDKVRSDLHQIQIPAFIFSSIVDHIVPPENSREIYNLISSQDKTIFFLKNSYHVATLDNDKELIADECIRFIRKLSAT